MSLPDYEAHLVTAHWLSDEISTRHLGLFNLLMPSGGWCWRWEPLASSILDAGLVVGALTWGGVYEDAPVFASVLSLLICCAAGFDVIMAAREPALFDGAELVAGVPENPDGTFGRIP